MQSTKGKILKLNKKDKDIYISIIFSFGIRGLAMIISLFTMPAYMRFFNDNTILGLWFTIISILNWFLNFDLGIGNGLRNKLVPCFVDNDYDKSKKYISSAYIIISIIALFAVLCFSILVGFINWNVVFNIDDSIVSNNLLVKVVLISFIGIVFQFVLRIINSILYAMQKSHIPGLITLITSIITLTSILILGNSTVSNNLIRLSLINLFATNIPLLITTIIIFNKFLKNSKPSFSYFRKKYAKTILKLGGIFFGIQIMYMIITNTNEFMITFFYNPSDVVDYQIYNKLFNLISVVFNLAMVPMWSSITKAISEKDYSWINKTYDKLKKIAILFICIEFILVPFLQLIVNIWLGNKAININYLYSLFFAIYSSLAIWSTIVSSMSNGLSKVKSQFVLMILAVVIEFVLLLTITKVVNNWITIVLINTIAIIPYCVIETFIINKYLKKLKEEI